MTLEVCTGKEDSIKLSKVCRLMKGTNEGRKRKPRVAMDSYLLVFVVGLVGLCGSNTTSNQVGTRQNQMNTRVLHKATSEYDFGPKLRE
jgi:hypothetical protein